MQNRLAESRAAPGGGPYSAGTSLGVSILTPRRCPPCYLLVAWQRKAQLKAEAEEEAPPDSPGAPPPPQGEVNTVTSKRGDMWTASEDEAVLKARRAARDPFAPRRRVTAKLGGLGGARRRC